MAYNQQAGANFLSGLTRGLLQARQQRHARRDQILDAYSRDPEGAANVYQQELDKFVTVEDQASAIGKQREAKTMGIFSQMTPEQLSVAPEIPEGGAPSARWMMETQRRVGAGREKKVGEEAQAKVDAAALKREQDVTDIVAAKPSTYPFYDPSLAPPAKAAIAKEEAIESAEQDAMNALDITLDIPETFSPEEVNLAQQEIFMDMTPQTQAFLGGWKGYQAQAKKVAKEEKATEVEAAADLAKTEAETAKTIELGKKYKADQEAVLIRANAYRQSVENKHLEIESKIAQGLELSSGAYASLHRDNMNSRKMIADILLTSSGEPEAMAEVKAIRADIEKVQKIMDAAPYASVQDGLGDPLTFDPVGTNPADDRILKVLEIPKIAALDGDAKMVAIAELAASPEAGNTDEQVKAIVQRAAEILELQEGLPLPKLEGTPNPELRPKGFFNRSDGILPDVGPVPVGP